MHRFPRTAIAFALVVTIGSHGFAVESTEWIETIKQVDSFGKNHAAAVAAAQKLSKADFAAGIEILQSMTDANPLAINWLQGAFESIAARSLKDGSLDAAALEEYVIETDYPAKGRWLAYNWLIRVDDSAADRLIPGMIEDPCPELRREAVERAISEAEMAPQSAKIVMWKNALRGAVDEDQVTRIAKELEDLNSPIDLVEHFGFLTEWYLIGPFDNREMKGFDVAYPPEGEVNLDAKYEGMKGEVAWEKFRTTQDSGEFDIAKLTAPHKGAIDYAYTEFESGAEQTVQFRLSTKNAWKLWLNGELLFAREEYHRGTRFDQYTVTGTLRQGSNTLLLKVCQNEQDQDWAQDWSFRFRVCDGAGQAIHSADTHAAAAR